MRTLVLVGLPIVMVALSVAQLLMGNIERCLLGLSLTACYALWASR